MNGDPQSEKLCSELGPGCEALDGRNVNIESLYEVSAAAWVRRTERIASPAACSTHHTVYISVHLAHHALDLDLDLDLELGRTEATTTYFHHP